MTVNLLTPEVIARFAEVGRQEHVKDPIVIAKFFHPLSGMTWYATEYDPEDRVFFGWVWNGPMMSELGYFSLDEMEELRVRGLPMERDLHFRERPLSAAKREHGDQ
jgi:hypothetical protein